MREIICPNPNCGYRGKPRKEAEGSCLITLLLLCFGILPGILYLALKGGCRHYCPKCGVQIGTHA